MSMTRPLNRTTVIAAATLVAAAAPGAILTGPAVAKTQRRIVAAQSHRRLDTTRPNRKLHVLYIRHGGPQL
jgi:hypothetical protein